MTDKSPGQAEIESLRNHNAELLAELKKVKKKLSESEESNTALREEADSKALELNQIKLDIPVKAMCERVSVLPGPFLREFEERGYKFELDGDDIVIRNNDGQPVSLGEQVRTSNGWEYKMREAKFTEDDIGKLVCEDWLPEEKRSEHVKNFLHMVIATRARGAGPAGSKDPGFIGSSDNPSSAQSSLNVGLK